MVSLTKQGCKAFTQALASKAPVPGGGGAAALAGALGTALCAMVGNFTVGKKKYAAVEADVQAMLERCQALQERFLHLVEEDAAAFEPLSRAYAIPKDAPDRAQVLEEATWQASQAPAEMVRCCAQAVALLEEMLEKGSRLLLSDVGCGALLCRAAMESAALNVFVNTAALKDRQAAGELEREMDALLQDALPRADQVAKQVTERIRKKEDGTWQ